MNRVHSLNDTQLTAMKWALLASGIFCIYLGTMAIDLQKQMILGWGMVAIIAVMKQTRFIEQPLFKIFILTMVTFVSARYLLWRMTDTLVYTYFIEFFFVALVFIAEIEVAVNAATNPLPLILANGDGADLTAAKGERVTLDVMLSPGSIIKQSVDWWLVVKTSLPPPHDWYHFTPPSGWSPGLAAALQGPCVFLKPFRVLDMKLPPGSYVFYFGVDTNPNGMPDMLQMSYTKAAVKIVP